MCHLYFEAVITTDWLDNETLTTYTDTYSKYQAFKQIWFDVSTACTMSIYLYIFSQFIKRDRRSYILESLYNHFGPFITIETETRIYGEPRK